MSRNVGIGYSFKDVSMEKENEELKKEIAKLKAKAEKEGLEAKITEEKKVKAEK